MKMTLFADASFCHKTGAGGWGAWAKRDDWPKGEFLGGPLDCELRSSTTAELCGIACALWHCFDVGHLSGVSSLMVQCDNTEALSLIGHMLPTAFVYGSGDRRDQQHLPAVKPGRLRKLSIVENEALTVIATAVGDTRVLLRHVKGHTDRDTGRAWVNGHCDAEARRHMEVLRKQRGGMPTKGRRNPK